MNKEEVKKFVKSAEFVALIVLVSVITWLVFKR